MSEKCLGPDELVDAAGMDSFPASDTPPWAPTHVGTPSAAMGGPELFHDLVQRLHDHVRLLSETIGERNDRSPRALQNLGRAAEEIARRFSDAKVPVRRRRASEVAFNVEAILRGGDRAGETVVVGAHYDSPPGSLGADDNASGVAVLLSLAHMLPRTTLRRTVRLVAFAGGQPPHAGTETMGSRRYIEDLRREGPRVCSMMSLESLGLYMTELPWPMRLVPTLRSDLLLIGDRHARHALERAKAAFDGARTGIAVSMITLPWLLADVRRSDHWPFRQEGIDAFMVTDTAPFWASHYHGPSDTPDRLDYERLGSTCQGLAAVVRALANA